MDVLPMWDEQAKAFESFNESQRRAEQFFTEQADQAIERAKQTAAPQGPEKEGDK
jgi:hypothetical protein